MGAVWMLARHELRGRWRSTIALAVLVPVSILVVNLLAALPAWSAARTRPATVLRSE